MTDDYLLACRGHETRREAPVPREGSGGTFKGGCPSWMQSGSGPPLLSILKPGPKRGETFLPRLCPEDQRLAGDELAFIPASGDARGVWGSVAARWSFKDQGTELLDVGDEFS